MRVAKIHLAVATLLVAFNSIEAQCGTERWPVKILEDSEAPQINFTPRNSHGKKTTRFLQAGLP
jgi:hypothetical protein